MAITIREASASDIDTIACITQAAFEQHRGLLDPPSSVWQETVEDVRRSLEEGLVFLACEDGAPVGAARTQPVRDDPGALYCGRVAVLPALQGRGIGRAIMAHVEQFARSRGYAAVVIGVRIQLPRNIAFYKRLGYRVVREVCHPGYDHPTYVMMRKDLS